MNPAALWLLLLVALILLLPRRPSARVRRPVGNLYLWTQPVARDPVALALRRLRRHWLLLLQAAFMVAVIAALARPVLSWHPKQIVLIVDVSASMGALDGDVTRLDRARAAVRPALESVPRASRLRLITPGAVPADLGEFQRGDAALIQALGRLRSTGATADIAGAIRDARIGGPADQLIVVASDQPDGSGGDPRVHWITVGHPAPNFAVTGVAARRFPSAPADGEVVTSVRSYGAAASSVDVEISQDGRAPERRRLRIEPGETTVVVTRIANIGGVVRARIVTPDALPIDNERLAIVPPRQTTRVLLVGGRNFFLGRALSTHPDLELDSTQPDAAGPAADVVVCDPCTAAPGGSAGVLIVATGGTPSDPAPLTISLPDHPLAAALEVPQILASTLAGPPLPEGAEVVLRAGGAPAVIAYERDGRRFAELRLNLASSAQVPLSTAFPIIVDNIVGWLAGRDQAGADVLAGEPLRWRVPVASKGDGSLRGPDGSVVPAQRAGTQLTAIGTATPGVYSTDTGRAFAVNPVTAGESDLSRTAIEPPSHATDDGAAREAPRGEIAALLLAGALVVLAIEWWYRGRWAVQG